VLIWPRHRYSWPMMWLAQYQARLDSAGECWCSTEMRGEYPQRLGSRLSLCLVQRTTERALAVLEGAHREYFPAKQK
jgi:hypothetical protein